MPAIEVPAHGFATVQVLFDEPAYVRLLGPQAKLIPGTYTVTMVAGFQLVTERCPHISDPVLLRSAEFTLQ